MDTRTKILKLPQALEMAEALRGEGKPLQIVTGHFDPMLAAHAVRLEKAIAAGHAVLVLVTDPAEPLLPGADRVALVAALRAVDAAVQVSERQVASVVHALRPAVFTRFEEDDELLSQSLVRHIRNRHAG